MKKNFLLLAVFTAFFSCKNEPEELFTLTYQFDVIYEAGLNQFETHYIDTYNLDTRIAESLRASGKSESEIGSIVPKSALLINRLTGAELDFIRDLSVRVFTGSELDPEEMTNVSEIYFRENIPFNSDTAIDLLPALPNVMDQMLEEKFNISIRTQLRSPPPTTIEAKLEFKFAVRQE